MTRSMYTIKNSRQSVPLPGKIDGSPLRIGIPTLPGLTPADPLTAHNIRFRNISKGKSVRQAILATGGLCLFKSITVNVKQTLSYTNPFQPTSGFLNSGMFLPPILGRVYCVCLKLAARKTPDSSCLAFQIYRKESPNPPLACGDILFSLRVS